MTFSPTKTLLLLALALLGLAVASLWIPELVFMWLMGCAAFVLLLGADVLLLPRKDDLVLTRKLPTESGVGGEVELALSVTNNGTRAINGRLWDILPQALDGSREPILFNVAPGQSADYAHKFIVQDRGQYVLDRATFEARGPLNLMRRILRLSAKAQLNGIPGVELLHSNRLILAAMRDADAGVNRARGVGRGGEFESLAPYVPGDPPQSVDWKAYARTGQLSIRRFEPERRRHIMLCCDAGRLMGGRVAGRRKVDHALASLARLAAASLQRGDLVGLMIFDQAVRVLIPPRAAAGQLARIIRASLEVKSSHNETAFTPAFVAMGHALSRRALVVIATDFDNEAQGWELQRNIAAVRKRHAVVVCSVRDPVYHETVEAEVKDSDDAYRQLAALTLLEERSDILHRIQQGGVHTIDAEPEEIAAPLLNLYGRIINSGSL
jgi:uncharacterized protein (DUF58 family)